MLLRSVHRTSGSFSFVAASLSRRVIVGGQGLVRHSHGASLGEVYARYKSLDEHLGKVRPDLIDDTKKIDDLLSKGEITPTMAIYYNKEIAKITEAKKAAEYWRKILWYVGVPLTILIAINTYYLEKEHAEHLEEHPHVPPDYPHLHVRNKKFFWGDGDHTPFHNPQVNGP